MKLLKNNGQPSAITIYSQRFIDYMGPAHKGKFDSFHIIIGMVREESIDHEVEKFRIGEDEKVIIHHKNGEYQRREIVPIDKSFVVTHYPHIVNFKVGLNQYNERRYNVLRGQTAQIENDDDADIIFKTFSFVDEVNEKGEIIRENRWQEDKKLAEKRRGLSAAEKVDLSQVPKSYQEVDWQRQNFRQTPPSKMIKEIIEDKKMETEEGEKRIL